MSDVVSLEPAIDPNNRISFLLDWEITMKCNLDCTYCQKGTYGGHDNSTQHPSLESCLDTIDFLYQYADLYMQRKSRGIRYAILNVYGGESLHHPHIVEILKECRRRYQEQYQDSWPLTITTTTNAIITRKKLDQIIPLIDEFTCSYHTEASDKQKLLFKENLCKIRDAGRRLKCVILVHPEPDRFQDSQDMIAWCEQEGIKYLPRQLDHTPNRDELNYNHEQVIWFESMYSKKAKNSSIDVEKVYHNGMIDLSQTGRACCGGRQLCKDGNQKDRHFFVQNKFPDWYCSVNEFFVYVKQVNGEIFVNKDCKMNFDGQVKPIGHLPAWRDLVEYTKTNLDNNTLPVIQCKKTRCLCGLCAPKAPTKEGFDSIMRKYRPK